MFTGTPKLLFAVSCILLTSACVFETKSPFIAPEDRVQLSLPRALEFPAQDEGSAIINFIDCEGTICNAELAGREEGLGTSEPIEAIEEIYPISFWAQQLNDGLWLMEMRPQDSDIEDTHVSVILAGEMQSPEIMLPKPDTIKRLRTAIGQTGKPSPFSFLLTVKPEHYDVIRQTLMTFTQSDFEPMAKAIPHAEALPYAQ